MERPASYLRRNTSFVCFFLYPQLLKVAIPGGSDVQAFVFLKVKKIPLRILELDKHTDESIKGSRLTERKEQGNTGV